MLRTRADYAKRRSGGAPPRYHPYRRPGVKSAYAAVSPSRASVRSVPRRSRTYSPSGSLSLSKAQIDCGTLVHRVPSNVGSLVKNIGDFHYIRNLYQGQTSSLTANNPMSIRFHPSCNAEYMGSNGGWTNMQTNSYGTGNFGSPFPTYEKFYYKSINFRVVLTQVSENCRVRLQIVNPLQNSKSNTVTRLLNYNTAIDQFQNMHNWRVVKEIEVNFDDPIDTNDLLVPRTTNQRVKVFNFKWDIDRWFKTNNGSAASAVGHWDSSSWNSQTFFTICSNDISSADAEKINVDVYAEHVFYASIQ